MLIGTVCFGQLQPIDYTPPDADNLKEAAIKINANDAYLEDQIKLKANLAGSRIIGVAMSDLTTELTAGTNKATFRMPIGMTLTSIRASLLTAQTGGSVLTIDINEDGVSILSTKLTIDNTEKTSTTATTAAVISDSVLADDAEITFDIDQAGDGGAGLVVWLIGY